MQHARQRILLGGIQRLCGFGKVPEFGVDRCFDPLFGQRGLEFFDAERRKRGAAAQLEDISHV